MYFGKYLVLTLPALALAAPTKTQERQIDLTGITGPLESELSTVLSSLVPSSSGADVSSIVTEISTEVASTVESLIGDVCAVLTAVTSAVPTAKVKRQSLDGVLPEIESIVSSVLGSSGLSSLVNTVVGDVEQVLSKVCDLPLTLSLNVDKRV